MAKGSADIYGERTRVMQKDMRRRERIDVRAMERSTLSLSLSLSLSLCLSLALSLSQTC